MALMTCGDCNAAVSSQAATCPRCNAPPNRFQPNRGRSARPYLIGIGSALVGAAITFTAILGYGLRQAANATLADSTDAEAAAHAAVRDATRGRPNFVVERRGDYGYQLVSDKNGSALMFFRYLGTEDHVTRFAEIRPDKTMVFSCTGMCDQVRVGQYMGGHIMGETTVDVVGGSMLYAVIEDIIQGRIKPNPLLPG